MSSAPTYGSRWPQLAKWWDAATILPNKASEVNRTAQRLVSAKERYERVEAVTGVPWYMIAIIHERESGQSWKASLAQGDPWNRVSTHVPAGRGPFHSWEEAAVDALSYDRLNMVKDWRLEKILYYLEKYNGWGYYYRSLPSPYVWAATNIQKPGKFVADGHWSAGTVDQQLGGAAMLKAMMRLDSSIKPIRETVGSEVVAGLSPTQAPGKPKSKAPTVATGTIVAAGAGAAASFFWGPRSWGSAAMAVVAFLIVVGASIAAVWWWRARQ